jgi:hypothetical protein
MFWGAHYWGNFWGERVRKTTELQQILLELRRIVKRLESLT